MPKRPRKQVYSPSGANVTKGDIGETASAVLAPKTVNYAFGEPIKGYINQQVRSGAMSALKGTVGKGLVKAVGGAAIPTAAAVLSSQPSYQDSANNPWIDTGETKETYMARKTGGKLPPQYPSGVRGPSYVKKPAYAGQSVVSSLMGVKR